MEGSSPGVLGCTLVLVLVLVDMVASVPVNFTNGTFGQLYTHTVGF